MQVAEWNFSLGLTTVVAIRDALDAFLRTSQHGEWNVDPAHQTDGSLRYYRGHWKEVLVPVYRQIRSRREAPAQLEIQIQGPRLAVTYRFYWYQPVSEEFEDVLHPALA
jgi:hypothetical protein